MEINIVFFVAVLLIIGGGVKGYKRGLVEEIKTVVALILAILAIGMFVVAVRGYMEKETLRTILGIICLTIAAIVYKIADFILSTLKTISNIPVIHGVDKLTGFLAGVLEAVVLLWIVFLVITLFEFNGISEAILTNIKENELLLLLYQYNPLTKLLADVLPVITVLSELKQVVG